MSVEDRVEYWKRRARDAERCLVFEKEETESTRLWAVNAFDQERRLRDRCTYLYGLAARHGATDEELHTYFAEGTHESLAEM